MMLKILEQTPASEVFASPKQTGDGRPAAAQPVEGSGDAAPKLAVDGSPKPPAGGVLGAPRPLADGGLVPTKPVESGRRLPALDRTATVSPLDLRQTKFQTSMRGFDKNEVTAFLLEAAEGYDQALRENERLRQELIRLETSLTQYRELEGSLKTTLMTAQKVADDLRENAEKDAARIVREAEGQAELIVQRAQGRQDDLQRETETLRLKRRDAESSLEAVIAAINGSLQVIREQDQREARVFPHRPPVAVAG